MRERIRLIRQPSEAGARRVFRAGHRNFSTGSRHFIQAKLTVGPAGDHYEQEADRVANQVMARLATRPAATGEGAQCQAIEDEELLQGKRLQRQPEEEELMMKPLAQRQPEEEELMMKPLVQRQSIEDEELLQGKHIQRQSIEDEELLQGKWLRRQPEEEELMMKPVVGVEGGDLDADTDSAINAARSGGSPLPDPVRRDMESAFGADFSGVRVHTGSRATELNESLSARAFTTGSDIFVRNGDYQPTSASGQELLAHELTHVIQQGGGTARRHPARERSSRAQRHVLKRAQPRQSPGSAVHTSVPSVIGLIQRRRNISDDDATYYFKHYRALSEQEQDDLRLGKRTKKAIILAHHASSLARGRRLLAAYEQFLPGPVGRPARVPAVWRAWRYQTTATPNPAGTEVTVETGRGGAVYYTNLFRWDGSVVAEKNDRTGDTENNPRRAAPPHQSELLWYQYTVARGLLQPPGGAALRDLRQIKRENIKNAETLDTIFLTNGGFTVFWQPQQISLDPTLETYTDAGNDYWSVLGTPNANSAVRLLIARGSGRGFGAAALDSVAYGEDFIFINYGNQEPVAARADIENQFDNVLANL